MYHFFVEPDAVKDKTITITGKDVNHIKNVLRMKPGEELSVSTKDSQSEYRCIVRELFDDRIVCELAFIKEEGNELPSKIYLFQGLPKSDKMELIIQKAVELGAFEIIPVEMKRCVMKIDPKKAASKLSRWNGISEAAAKQAKRTIIPEIKTPMGFKDAVDYAKNLPVKLLPYELADGMARTKEIFSNLKAGEDIAIFIGPEGGFEQSEVELAKENGFETITLGKRILRTETAGMAVIARIMFELEET
ncbi:MAG: 16S rRNA (uracil(1498)-N(3))-methyltransferase [Lachnospiraceae bacterium]|nr:16S rRNA (uracil(1498)-N(3))-methyltransferase [Lachnospiraceae bacterium]MBO7599954.1 16S rRNA (uracil(1498)-N(3))-methyltransferase [Lachnospiraceae bacterium]